MKEYSEGKSAYKQDKRLEDNPYSHDSQEAVNWVNGWLNADALENREYIGLGSSATLHY